MPSVCLRNMTAHCVSDSVTCLIPEHYSSLYALLLIFKTEHYSGSLCVYFRFPPADGTVPSVCSSGTRERAVLLTELYLVAAIRQCAASHQMITAQCVTVCAVCLHLRNNAVYRITGAALCPQIKNTPACGLTP
jgi:hypothetical protein